MKLVKTALFLIHENVIACTCMDCCVKIRTGLWTGAKLGNAYPCSLNRPDVMHTSCLSCCYVIVVTCCSNCISSPIPTFIKIQNMNSFSISQISIQFKLELPSDSLYEICSGNECELVYNCSMLFFL